MAAASESSDESFNFSDFEDNIDEIEDAPQAFAPIRGYNFEPRRRSRVTIAPKPNASTERLGNTNWCVSV